jgi:hypothetical protein
MLVPPFFNRVNYNLRGTDDEAPVSGTEDYDYWIDTFNRIKDELYGDVSKKWRGSWTTKNLGVIAANAAPSFNLDASYLGSSDYIYIIDVNGQRHEYDVVQPQDRDIKCREVYISGMNPEVLYFTNAILTGEDIIGGTLYAPGFWLPPDITGDASTIPLTDPNWGAMRMAAELAFNDLTYEDKAPDLNNKATNLYNLMAARNRLATTKNPNTSKDKVRHRIKGF